MVELRCRIGALLLALVPLAAAADTAREQRFEYVTAMPQPRGEPARTLDRVDPATGRHVVKDVFTVDAGELRILTHVARVACSTEAPSEPYILAIQYLPKSPKTFQAATLYDTFEEVYVADETARIRLYRRVSGADMMQLTERMLPACPAA